MLPHSLTWAPGVVVLALLLCARPASACDCAAAPPSATQALARAGLVVVGQVKEVSSVATSSGPAESSRLVQVAVERIVVGETGALLEVDWDFSTCTGSVTPGERVLLYVARPGDGRPPQLHGCDGSSRVSTGREAELELGDLERQRGQCLGRSP